MSIFDLTATCPADGFPSKPGEVCPVCQITNPYTPGFQLKWHRRVDYSGTSYSFVGPIHVHIGQWKNNDDKENMWHVHMDDYHFFLPASLGEGQLLAYAETLLVCILNKMVCSITRNFVNVMTPSLIVEDDPDF